MTQFACQSIKASCSWIRFKANIIFRKQFKDLNKNSNQNLQVQPTLQTLIASNDYETKFIRHLSLNKFVILEFLWKFQICFETLWTRPGRANVTWENNLWLAALCQRFQLFVGNEKFQQKSWLLTKSEMFLSCSPGHWLWKS